MRPAGGTFDTPGLAAWRCLKFYLIIPKVSNHLGVSENTQTTILISIVAGSQRINFELKSCFCNSCYNDIDLVRHSSCCELPKYPLTNSKAVKRLNI